MIQLHFQKNNQLHRSSYLYAEDDSDRSATRHSQTKGWLNLLKIWQQIFQKLSQGSPLEIEESINSRGETWWQVTDPRSGKSFYGQTLNEVVHWIEAQHLGR